MGSFNAEFDASTGASCGFVSKCPMENSSDKTDQISDDETSGALINRVEEYRAPCESRTPAFGSEAEEKQETKNAAEDKQQETKQQEDKQQETKQQEIKKTADTQQVTKKSEDKQLQTTKAEDRPVEKKADKAGKPPQPADKQADKDVKQPAEKQAFVVSEMVPIPADVKQIASRLNPKFKDLTTAQLYKRLSERTTDTRDVDAAKDVFRELINRYDLTLPPSSMSANISTIELVSRALKDGKTVTDRPNGSKVLSDESLSSSRRWNYHVLVASDLETLNLQVATRLNFAQFLASTGQYADAEKMGIEARDKAEVLTKPIEVNGVKVSPIELMKRESKQLVADLLKISDPVKRQDMQRMSIYLNGEDGAAQSPISTNRFLALLYLGTKVVSTPGKGEFADQQVLFGQTSAFKVNKAYDAAERARKYSKEILGIDPLDPKNAKENPSVASLFGGLTEVLDNPEKYNIYKDENGDGKPDLIQIHEVENIKRAIHNNSDLTSILLDLGVMTLGTAAISLSRNPKVLAAFERNLGKFAFNGKMAKVVAGTTAVGGGLALRHYGYKSLVGLDEHWSDSALHTAGALSAGVAYKLLFGHSITAKPFVVPPPTLIKQASEVARRASIAGLVTATGMLTAEEFAQRNRFHNMLKKAQQPIENEALPTQKVDDTKQPKEEKEKKKP
ncbi:MAG: hypothetical protein K2X93_12205 [Candidatus Obscuribacterales bacterium]|nr:hypothetical protein [Candidatus Obscuribacterales bacterium]